jgi:hypothetical protein
LQPEPVSPELVLVDPELARRERARLEEAAYLREVIDAATLPIRVEPSFAAIGEPGPTTTAPRRSTGGFARRRLLPAALMCSLLVNGFLVAELLADEPQQTSAAAEPASLSSSAVPQTLARRFSTRGATRADVTRRSVERKLASFIVAAPAGKLPRRFVDPATGLVKNNVQIACSRKPRSSFVCAVRLPGDRVSRSFFVHYRARANGEGSFSWSLGGTG